MGESILFASESCAFDAVGAEFVRDIEPGEIVVVDAQGVRSIRSRCGGPSAMCVFEFIYFARPDSVIDGSSVHIARQRAGAFLALQHPVQADVGSSGYPIPAWTPRWVTPSRAASPMTSAF